MRSTEKSASPSFFYKSIYEDSIYANFVQATDHFATGQLQEFVQHYSLVKSKALEVGSGRGAFQDLVEDYTGLDISPSVERCYQKPFFVGSAESLPFDDNSFDVVWSITVLEHIPNPEKALTEMRRVLRPGGLLYLHPAWHCRPWICEGIPVRQYSDLSLRQKWVKLTLPIRDSLLLRAARALPLRLWHLLTYPLSKQPLKLRYKPLKADYETFWMVDSDACCALDPLDVIQWFQSRGDTVLSHPTRASALLSRSEAVVVRIERGERGAGKHPP
jgi:SAM-dependent methyltransferase